MQEPPPSPSPLAMRSSAKQNFKVGSSSSMDAEVVEIPPPGPRSSKPLKQKEAFVYEVIDDDSDEDIADSAIIEKELDKLKKGKAKVDASNDHLNGYSTESLPDNIYISSDDLAGAINGTQQRGTEEGSHTSFNGDGQIYDLAEDDDDYMDYIFEDVLRVDDDYDLLQAHFDNMDIPPGVEAPVPWLPGMFKNEMKSDAVNSVHSLGFLRAGTAGLLQETESSGLTESVPFGMSGTFTSTSGSHGHSYSVSQSPQVDQSKPWLPILSMHSKKNRAGSQRKGSGRKFSFGLKSFKSRPLLDSFRNKKSPVSSSNSTHFSSPSQLSGAQYSSGVDPSNWDHSALHGVNKQTVSHSSYSSFPQTVSSSSSYTSFPQQIFSQNKASTRALSKTWLKDPSKYSVNHPYASPAAYSSDIQPFDPSVYDLPEEDVGGQLPQYLSGDHTNKINDVLMRFENFKHFDTIQDHSDHHYSTNGCAVKQPSKSWAKRIQEEWKILEKDLPETIFIRVYETRMDLLRAVIVGAEGTPYHDGLYFFDVFFPSGYPNCPPDVYYHSRGIRLNPNLYSSGKVCLSLLNTWSGEKNEKWMPGVSTMLQVLVSIQGLILNVKPYFNEPGCARSQGSAYGEKMSLKYNEDTFILSLRTMTYVIRRPPKHFEDFVMGHFFKRAQDILMACQAYIQGAQVGSLLKGGVQDVDAGEKGCSSQFKHTLTGYVGILAKAFMNIGVRDCEKYLTPPPPVKETKTQVGVTIVNHPD